MLAVSPLSHPLFTDTTPRHNAVTHGYPSRVAMERSVPAPYTPERSANVQRIDGDVLQILETVECDGQSARLTCGQLDRQTYVRVNKVLEALGGKWNRKAKAHLFDGLAAEVLGDAVTAGEYVDAKKQFQFFETPEAVADVLLNGHRFRESDRVLEPSAGRGALIRAVLARGGSVPDSVELNGKHHADLSEFGGAVHIGDFLETTVPQLEGPFDAVVMNPPFTRSQDIRHVCHAFDFVKPGGMLFAVMACGWTFRQDSTAVEFRKWLDCVPTQWERLPENAFRESGTGVNAVVVRIQKPE